jgi:hypothetical protein
LASCLLLQQGCGLGTLSTRPRLSSVGSVGRCFLAASHPRVANTPNARSVVDNGSPWSGWNGALVSIWGGNWQWACDDFQLDRYVVCNGDTVHEAPTWLIVTDSSSNLRQNFG